VRGAALARTGLIPAASPSADKTGPEATQLRLLRIVKQSAAVASSPSSSSLLAKTVAQLRELARSLGVGSYARLAKEELMEVLSQAQPEECAPQ